MNALKILLCGVFILGAVLLLTAAIIGAAPYIAALIVLAGLVWFFLSKAEKEDEPPEP